MLQSQYNTYLSNDGGMTWSEDLDPPVDGFKRDMTVMDNGDWIYVGMSENVIARTSDKGQTWMIDTLPFYISEISEVGNGVLFGGNRSGIVTKSTDYGATWMLVKEEDESGFFSSFHFDTENNGYRVASSIMYATTDGGLTWEQAHAAPVASNIVYMTDSIFLSQSTQLYYVTNNGGKDWELLRYGEGRPIIYTGFHPLDENTVFAYGLNRSILKSRNIFESTSWQSVDEDIFEHHITGMDFLDAMNGVACDGEGTIFITEDGGDTWKSMRRVLPGAGRNILYTNEGDVLVSLDEALVKTSDWITYDTIGSFDNNLGNMQRLNDNIYVRANEGIFISEDAGNTWTLLLDKQSLFGLHAVNKDLIYVSKRDTVFQTLDAGQTWKEIYVTSAATIAGTDEDNFVVHCNDSIRITSNGGLSFEAVAREPRNGQRMLKGKDDEYYMYGHSGTATNQGFMYKSIDGGRTWKTDLDFNSCMGVHGMAYNTATEQMWYFGAGGNIIRDVLESTSTNEFKLDVGTLNIFPNPSFGDITIDIPENFQEGNFMIVDQLGRSIYTNQVERNSTQLEVEDLPEGFYMVYMSDDRKQYVGKLLITNY
ncbi:MAG: T9SS type A sorting domain-containing protein [Bacteroidota bacterium]